MMHNPYRAEHSLKLDGEFVSLKMTLGALAALEASVNEKSLPSLLSRFCENKFQTEDLIHVLNAGLYGAGSAQRVENCEIGGGATEAVKVARELLVSAFPSPDQ